MLKWNKLVPSCFVLLVMTLLVFNCGVNADTWNKKTYMTFNESVEIGGKVLPAGKYVFKLMDSSSNRHIVQILNEEETQVIDTILAIPNYRMNPTDETVVKLDERPSGQPPAIRAWFYPGDTIGEEFVSRAPSGELVARVSPVPVAVPTTIEPASPEITETPSPSVEETPQAQVQPQEQPAVETEKQAEPMTAQPQEQPKTETEAQEELPQTASYLPLAGLAGMLSFGAAAALRLSRKVKS